MPVRKWIFITVCLMPMVYVLTWDMTDWHGEAWILTLLFYVLITFPSGLVLLMVFWGLEQIGLDVWMVDYPYYQGQESMIMMATLHLLFIKVLVSLAGYYQWWVLLPKLYEWLTRR